MSHLLPKCPPSHFYDDESCRFVPYVALNINRGGIELVGDMVQRIHPLDAVRRQNGGPDSQAAASIACRTPGCQNKASERNPRCSSCRMTKCRCGRVMSRSAARCKVCAVVDRRAKPMAWV